jgi:hypothetical protein
MIQSSIAQDCHHDIDAPSASKLMNTQSSGDAQPPTALAILYLEDGTRLEGMSFGCHESVEGEVK